MKPSETMIPTELLDRIEGGRFAAENGVVSSQRHFETAVREHPAVVELHEHLQESENQEALFRRVVELSIEATDRRYQHGMDTALATYLLALEEFDPESAEIAARQLVRLPNLFWARPVAHRLCYGEAIANAPCTCSSRLRTG